MSQSAVGRPRPRAVPPKKSAGRGGFRPPGPAREAGFLVQGVGAATAAEFCVKVALRVTVLPSGSVVVTVRVPLPFATEVSTVRSIVLPDAVVITSFLFHDPGATLVSVAVKVDCFPFAVVIVPFSEIEPGAVRTAVACQELVAPFGRVAEPVMVAVWLALFQVAWDFQVPVPPAAFVQEPWRLTVPWERVVVEEAVPEPPVLVV